MKIYVSDNPNDVLDVIRRIRNRSVTGTNTYVVAEHSVLVIHKKSDLDFLIKLVQENKSDPNLSAEKIAALTGFAAVFPKWDTLRQSQGLDSVEVKDLRNQLRGYLKTLDSLPVRERNYAVHIVAKNCTAKKISI